MQISHKQRSADQTAFGRLRPTSQKARPAVLLTLKGTTSVWVAGSESLVSNLKLICFVSVYLPTSSLCFLKRLDSTSPFRPNANKVLQHAFSELGVCTVACWWSYHLPVQCAPSLGGDVRDEAERLLDAWTDFNTWTKQTKTQSFDCTFWESFV